MLGRIEHPNHSTRDHRKRRFAEISPAGEWSSGRTYSAPEIDAITSVTKYPRRCLNFGVILIFSSCDIWKSTWRRACKVDRYWITFMTSAVVYPRLYVRFICRTCVACVIEGIFDFSR